MSRKPRKSTGTEPEGTTEASATELEESELEDVAGGAAFVKVKYDALQGDALAELKGEVLDELKGETINELGGLRSITKPPTR